MKKVILFFVFLSSFSSNILASNFKVKLDKINRFELFFLNSYLTIGMTTDTIKNKLESDILSLCKIPENSHDVKSFMILNKSYKRSKFLILANIAQSFRVAGTPSGLNSEQKKYIKQLKSGLSYDISTYYLKDSESGFGLKYNVYLSDGIIKNQPLVLQDGTTIRGDFTDDIKIAFIGPSFIMSQNENAKLGEANLEIALGYMSYVNNSTVIGAPTKISGGNLGMIGGMGYHFRLIPSVLLGPQVNFAGGVLRKLKFKYPDGTEETVKLDEDNFENLWRIDLALSAKFRF